MMPAVEYVKSFWWLVQKDVRRELRARHVWPGMLLLGLVIVLLLAAQVDLPAEQRSRVVGGLLWLAIFFAGTLALERSFTSERDDGCWQALLLYPLPPSVLFLAKMTVNLVALVMLELVLIPAFIVLCDVPLAAQPGLLMLVVLLASVGFAAIGTLTSALTAGLPHRNGLLALLTLPLVTPVVIGAAEATSLLLVGEVDAPWWRWVQLLVVFAVLFTTLGALLFEFVVED